MTAYTLPRFLGHIYISLSRIIYVKFNISKENTQQKCITSLPDPYVCYVMWSYNLITYMAMLCISLCCCIVNKKYQ